jgi:tetratricopeptide (TPR) repeat protein
MVLAAVTLLGVLKWLFVIGVGVWVLWRWLRKSEDEPRELLRKWLATAILGGLVILVIVFLLFANPFAGVGLITALGIVIGILWAPNFGRFLAKPFTAPYDGGGQEIERRPLYSIAVAKRKQGRYAEAVAEVQQQLEEFPDDFEGLMLCAEIQIENLRDFAAGQLTVRQIVANHPQHTPGNVAYALNRLADWSLQHPADRAAALRCLEEIRTLFPDTELAQLASQRIAHLASEEMLAERQDPHRLVVTPHDEYLGLRDDYTGLKPAPEDPAASVQRYLQHLEQYPLDNEAREKLALLYADSYGRLDLAREQLERLIQTPSQQPKHVIHWLNLLADLQITHEGDVEAARQTLKRITDLSPKGAAAENARTRMAYLNLEAKRRQKDPQIRLGVSPDKMREDG